MAINLSTGIYGFICSVKKTVEGIYQKHFLSGAAGHGWEIGEKSDGKYCLEIDDIVVRNTMTVFELLISKIRAVKGALAITQASGKVESVWDDDENYYLTIEDEMSFVPYDWIRCQSFSHEQRLYHVMVHEVEGNVIVIPRYEFDDQPAVPRAGDELVQFGNRVDKRRQNAIYLHADENGIPAIDVMLGITSKDWSKCVKLRMGGGLPDAPAEWNGLYCENGLIKAVDEDHNEIYMLRPDGSGFLANGNIRWDAEGNGAIFNDAIVWDGNGFRFGPGISLSWNNLTEDAKTNLKGEKGDKGEQGAPGADGNDGKDANLLDWVKDWNGSTTYIDGNKLLTGRIFGGIQETDGSLTGVAMGHQVFKNKDGQVCSGIFGVVKDEPKFILDPENEDYQFRGKVYAEEGTIGALEISNGEIVGRDENNDKTRIRISSGKMKDFEELKEEEEFSVYEKETAKSGEYKVEHIGVEAPPGDQTTMQQRLEFRLPNKSEPNKPGTFRVESTCELTLNYYIKDDYYQVDKNSSVTKYMYSLKVINYETQEIEYKEDIPWTRTPSAGKPIQYTSHIELDEEGEYYLEFGCRVRIDYAEAGDWTQTIRHIGNVEVVVDMEGVYNTQCTLIGSDGFYSYWGPRGYFYAKKDASGSLQIKMRGDIDIRDKDNKKLL